MRTLARSTLKLTHPKLVMAVPCGGHPDTPMGATGNAAAPGLILHRQRLWIAGTASLRSWTGNDEQNFR